MNGLFKSFAAVALASLLAGTSTNAADTNKWEGSGAVGVTLTSGNSDTFLGNVTLNATRKAPKYEILLGASATYGTTEEEESFTTASGLVIDRETSETTTANAGAFGQYNYLFTDVCYAGARLDFLHDAIADVSYRLTFSPLAGYYFIKNEKTRLAAEAGPSLVAERVGGENDEYIALRFAERFEHKFSDRAKVWQSVEYLPQIDRWGNYIINAEVGAEATLTQRLALRAVLQDTYDNEPADGRKKNDLKLITSLVYKF